MGQSGERSQCAGFVRLKECLACSLPVDKRCSLFRDAGRFWGLLPQYGFTAQSANSS